MLDLVSGQIDIAIRVGWLTDSGLQARRIGDFEQLLVASPQLACGLSGINQPEDLPSLPFVANAALREPLNWQFARGALERRTVRMTSSIAIDTTQAVHEVVRAGSGASVLPDYLVARDLAEKRLTNLLPGWSLPSGGIHAVFPAARFRPAKVRCFLDMVIQAERARRGVVD
jgi:DNA-binding transcriptional LysR family regulator